ncbi:MAG: hypothetical protein JRH11_11800 [Deltaproteobacteria bacterium]|nr:hypothetical protein [Deltaproteobacteria bacterium]
MTGIHVGARDAERLTLTRAIDEPPYTEVGMLPDLTPPSETATLGRVFVEVSGERLVVATSARPGGGDSRVYVVQATTALTGESVFDGPGERVSMAQSPLNETYGISVDGTFRMATFTGTSVAPTLSLGPTTYHATLGGELGPFRYVVVAIDDTVGVRLHGIGCM